MRSAVGLCCVLFLCCWHPVVATQSSAPHPSVNGHSDQSPAPVDTPGPKRLQPVASDDGETDSVAPAAPPPTRRQAPLGTSSTEAYQIAPQDRDSLFMDFLSKVIKMFYELSYNIVNWLVGFIPHPVVYPYRFTAFAASIVLGSIAVAGFVIFAFVMCLVLPRLEKSLSGGKHKRKAEASSRSREVLENLRKIQRLTAATY